MAAFEPEQYTRARAAIGLASALLIHRPARHQLLLLLLDGKPNDVDIYEGRYGREDMRQAVTEAKLQGIPPFCLAIDKQAAGYLPRVFGTGQYALLPDPELLSTVLLTIGSNSQPPLDTHLALIFLSHHNLYELLFSP
jgi:nitric oxide reductase NorD protein